MKAKIVILSLGFLILSFVMGITLPSYSLEDTSSRVSGNSSRVFSPGYVNIAKYNTESITRQQNADKGFSATLGEFIKNLLFDNAEEPLNNKPVPELKQKSSPLDETTVSNTTTDVVETTQANPAAQMNIAIGSGVPKVVENNRLISEVMDGKTYVYAGFDGVGKNNIRDAMGIASTGDTIVVKAGTYAEAITVKNGVSLYGGFNEAGARDLVNTPTVITGMSYYVNGRWAGWNGIKASNIWTQTVIDGFTIKSYGANYGIIASGNVTVSNNTFTTGYGMWAQSSYGSNIVIKDNKFAGKNMGLFVGTTDRRAIPLEWVTATINSTNNDYGGGYVKVGISASGMKVYVTSTNDYFAPGVITSYGSGALITRSGSPTSPVAQTVTVKTTQTTPAASTYLAAPLDYDKRYEYYNSENTILNTASGKGLNMDSLAGIFKGLINGKEPGIRAGMPDNNGLERINTPNAIQLDALSARGVVDLTNPKSAEMEIAAKLADILQNPTADQKVQIDILESLMKDLEQVQKETGGADLKKQERDLLQMVATVLLAQALPDLLKEGDISNIKGIFTNLSEAKSSILRDYQEATKPYYEEIKNVLLKNLTALHLSDILSKNIIQKDVENLSRNEIDKILDKLRKLSSRSFEEDYILQQEVKYREKYIDPNNRKLEAQMKTMLQDFTKRIYSTLNNAHIVKEDKEKGSKIIDLSKKRGE